MLLHPIFFSVGLQIFQMVIHPKINFFVKNQISADETSKTKFDFRPGNLKKKITPKNFLHLALRCLNKKKRFTEIALVCLVKQFLVENQTSALKLKQIITLKKCISIVSIYKHIIPTSWFTGVPVNLYKFSFLFSHGSLKI